MEGFIEIGVGRGRSRDTGHWKLLLAMLEIISFQHHYADTLLNQIMSFSAAER